MVLQSLLPIRLSLLLLLLTSICQLSESMPQFLVQSSKGKCFTVIAPQNTKLVVEYEAPDIIVDKKDPAYAPNWITVTSRPPKKTAKDYHLDPHDWQKHFHVGKVHHHGKPTSVELTEKKGSVMHTTQTSGDVQVCVKASAATSQTPMLFGIRVEKEDEVHAHEDLSKAVNLNPTDHHLTHMEVEMKHLVVSMKNILSEADFSKDREMAFHEKTMSMHAASMWWPIVQLSVLLLTGFTQVNHMVRFFQQRRIF